MMFYSRRSTLLALLTCSIAMIACGGTKKIPKPEVAASESDGKVKNDDSKQKKENTFVEADYVIPAITLKGTAATAAFDGSYDIETKNAALTCSNDEIEKESKSAKDLERTDLMTCKNVGGDLSCVMKAEDKKELAAKGKIDENGNFQMSYSQKEDKADKVKKESHVYIEGTLAQDKSTSGKYVGVLLATQDKSKAGCKATAETMVIGTK